MAQSKRSSEDAGDGSERISARDLTLLAKRTIEDLTDFKAESVSGFEWDGESWLVTVDVCELPRIPNTTDLMATYIVQLDDRGRLVGYKRDRRFQRGQAEVG